METVMLKNGSEEAKGLVLIATLSLRSLFNECPVAFYELVMCCRNRGHKPWGNTKEPLVALGLLQPDASPHESIKNIVLSAVEGEELDMKLVSPFKGA